MATTDQTITDDLLDRVLPLDAGGRWPEPRALWQRDVFHLHDRTPVDVDSLDARGARDLLVLLAGLAPVLHARAAIDERLTTCSGLRTAMATAGVPTVGDTDPDLWLESTLLVRVLRTRAAGASP